MKQTYLPLEKGEDGFIATEERRLMIVGRGPQAYIWIGNAETPQFCYATLSGERLKRFCKRLTASLNGKR